MEAQLGAWRQRSRRRLLRQRVATRPGDGGSHGRLVATVGRNDAWRRWVAVEASRGRPAVPEGHGEAWRRRSRRPLDDGPDVGS